MALDRIVKFEAADGLEHSVTFGPLTPRNVDEYRALMTRTIPVSPIERAANQASPTPEATLTTFEQDYLAWLRPRVTACSLTDISQREWKSLDKVTPEVLATEFAYGVASGLVNASFEYYQRVLATPRIIRIGDSEAVIDGTGKVLSRNRAD